MPVRPIIAALVLAASAASAAVAAEADLADASPAELQAVIERIAPAGAPSDQALRRAEAMFRLGDLNGDVGLIRRGADAASAVLSSLESGGRGALWVAASKDVGTALVMLARRTNDRSRLDEAIAAFESAALFARDSQPEQWPGLMNSLAIAQWTKGSMAKDAAALKLAHQTFREALSDRAIKPDDRERVRIQVNMASALVEMAMLTNEAAPADEAVTQLRAALAMAATLDLPAQTAIIQGNLAQALTVRGWHNKAAADVEQAVELGKAAISYWDSVGAIDARDDTEANLRQSYQVLTELYSIR
ncbi:hypothetical protein [Emcibacter sp. SYSU 3D8]|uniref:hypothetical protein n=1 Tax=Emcibacter sp. SYSU 3D8 TaxID=3133969 RepID=UPI0031FEBD7C